MKTTKLLRTALAFLSAAALLASPALAAALGTELDGYTLDVRSGTDYTYSVYWTGTDYRRENYLEYSPNDRVFPMVVYGSKLLNNGDFLSMARLLNAEGYYVIGGINGDYFNTWDNQPLGVVIKEGKLVTTDDGFFAVGFRSDGSAMMGRPGIVVRAAFSGETYQLTGVNKARLSGYALYTDDYAARTRNSTEGWDIVLAPEEDAALTLGGILRLTVEEIQENAGAAAIPEGKMLLSLPKTADEWRRKGLEALQVGDTVELTVDCAAGWEEAVTAIGTIYRLLENGQIVDDLPAGAAPRTAVGLKRDGGVIFYTIDGRRSGHSVGASMTQVAERLLELDCTDAILMDGGGSTTMNLVRPGESALSQINTPSEGQQRSVTDYLMLVSTEPPAGESARLVLSPYSLRMLPGASADLTVRCTDEVGFAAPVPEGLRFNGDLGSFEGSTFTAERPGAGTLTVSADGLESASARLLVVETPDAITVRRQDSSAAVASLKLLVGEEVDLTAGAAYDHLPLTAADESFTWTVEGEIGEIDSQGRFTAGEAPGAGTITAAAGERSVSVAVTVAYPAGRYADVPEDSWYFDAVLAMGQRGYMTGVSETEFAPDSSTTRAMLVTLLHRIEGAPAPGEAPAFEDVEAGKWYTDAVAWAAETGLVNGYDEHTFGVSDPITREQMATILCRYAAWKGEDVHSDQGLEHFADANEISAWALDSVRWAVERELLRGVSENEFSPQGSAARAQIAVLLDRYLAG